MGDVINILKHAKKIHLQVRLRSTLLKRRELGILFNHCLWSKIYPFLVMN